MKIKYLQSWTVLAVLLAGGSLVLAQRDQTQRGQSGNRRDRQSQNTSQIPGPTNYTAFATFINNRNIFDPGRYARRPGVVRPPTNNQRAKYAPAFAFVGAMAYSKGLFAFFDGNNDQYRKALQANGTIAGYTIKEISLNSVKLAAGDTTVDLPVGKQMIYDDSTGWSLGGDSTDFEGQGDNAGPGQMMEGRGRFNDMGGGPAEARSSSYGGAAGTTGAATPATPAAASGPMSDVLKRLMQQRQQESK